ncbi:urease accessory protein UreD [Ottowia sp. GY511]|uniref:Urease accessory protein UreD n=1 Tax=Ottowia flava TaxID=2675430 RepID=A0ABW4KV55_9BURK|nr:urease accessory protein UreD [Ottowia sp. GY511]TXK31470.1 urease accessory protein UreD [Ottowia sp. GY511]
MTWHADLHIDYRAEHGRCVARHRHSGPLRVLQSLYPEGDAVCHNVLVHPPGGIVGGDVLDIRVSVGEGAHGLVTTPGATRFYRSEGEAGVQRAALQVAGGGRLEWLPQEAICYSGCQAENHLTLDVAPGGELMGWDITALGLPLADQPFAAGSLLQHIEVPGGWLERGKIAASDQRLLESPLGLGGHRCLASVFFVAGAPLDRTRREQALDAARAALGEPTAQAAWDGGVTSPEPRVLVARVAAPVVEPAVAALRRVRGAWREVLWGLPDVVPRIWAT